MFKKRSAGEQGSTDLTETTYTYNGAGQPTRIGDETLSWKNARYRDVRCLQYDNDQRLWTVIRSSCGSSAGTPNRESAREFRYDQDGRQRYLARELDPTPSQFTGDLVFEPLTPEGWEFTDYAGNSPYLDSSMTDANGSVPARFAQKRSYGPGGWQDIADDPNDPNAPPSITATRVAHGDLIGSTVATTDDAHDPVATAAYTAFGELVGGAGSGSLDTRYRYVGGHGYEADVLYGSHDPLNGPNTNLSAITLLHVGARWYDPGIGRFVQRDPIGLAGGLNAYAYVANEALARIDPSGEGFWDGENPVHDWIARNFWIGLHGNSYVLSDTATVEALAISCLPLAYFALPAASTVGVAGPLGEGGYVVVNGKIVGRILAIIATKGEELTQCSILSAEGSALNPIIKNIVIPFTPF